MHLSMISKRMHIIMLYRKSVDYIQTHRSEARTLGKDKMII